MKPFRVEFELTGPMTRPDHPIHLDSLIAHQLVKTTLLLGASVAEMRAATADLPLQKMIVGEDWIWAASTLAFNWSSAPFQDVGIRNFRSCHIAKYVDVLSGVKFTSKIETDRGIQKTEQYAVSMQYADTAVAYGIGDIAKIQSLLEGIETLGARRRHATMAVLSVKVIEDNRGHDLWQKRYLPPSNRLNEVLMQGAYRLPLFDVEHRTIIDNNQLVFDDHFELQKAA